MRSTRSLVSVALLALVLVAAGGVDTEELLRQANAAFDNQEYEQAVKLYEEAEDWTTYPGRIAFNKAAALYRLERYREAELHYRRSLGDAEGPRLARMRFDLGNCLVRQSNGQDPDRLKEAVQCYRQALKHESSKEYEAEARHNLELAKLLWVQARSSQPKKDDGSTSEPDPPPPEPKETKEPKPVEVGKNDPGSSPTPKKGSQQPVEGGTDQKPIPVEQAPPPGSSDHLQPIPDEDELVPMPPEDTLRHLMRAAELIQRERLQHLRHSAPPAPAGVFDW